VLILINNISVSFQSKKSKFIALNNFNLEIEKNEFVSLVGHSGCGKTTLLNLIAGFLKPTSGTIQFEGKDILCPASDRVVVFQEDAVFPWLTVKKNIAYGLDAIGVNGLERENTVNKYLELVGLKSFADYYPKDLSGGMKKRVDLARAYAVNPKVLLMDEPFGALDAYTRQNMQSNLLNLWDKEKKTVVFVTHDISEAIFMSDKLVLMSPSPGTVHRIFKVPFERPRNQQIKKSLEFLSLQSEIEALFHSFEKADATIITK